MEGVAFLKINISKKIELFVRKKGDNYGIDTFCMDVFSGSGAWHEVAERADRKGVDSFRA